MLTIAPLTVPSNSVPSFWKVHAYGEVSSTNDVVKRALREGEAEGFCATALYQEGGYGRQGRRWASPVGGLYTSFALKPTRTNLPSLSLVVSLAVRDALIEMASLSDVVVKWPNDVLRGTNKMCGISLEAVAGGVCIGVGINVFPPYNAVQVGGKYQAAYLSFDRISESDLTMAQRAYMTEVLGSLLRCMEIRYQGWQAFGFEVYHEEYNALLAYKGHQATLETIDGTTLLSGVIHSVDSEGRLLIQTQEGRMVPAVSGEVHIATLD